MRRAGWMTPVQLAFVAGATGVGWGVVMALVAWLRDGTEIVLLQSWILVPAWLFGRAAGSPRSGALAGLALVAGAVWTYELLPGWGLDVALRREVTQPTERDAIAIVLDREDIVLLSTLAIGMLVGLGGGVRSRPRAASPVQEAEPPAFQPPQAPPPPLWARLGHPPVAEPPSRPEPPTARPEHPPSATPWGAAFLVAAAGTDLMLEQLFDMYSDPQGALAIAFAIAGGGAAAWLSRRHAVAMLLAGTVLASAFATVQHAEYGARADPQPSALVRALELHAAVQAPEPIEDPLGVVGFESSCACEWRHAAPRLKDEW